MAYDKGKTDFRNAAFQRLICGILDSNMPHIETQ